MTYVFFGTPRFGALVLQRLIERGMPPVAVVCNPDRPAGRKGTLTPPPAKAVAEANGIPVLQPEKLSEIHDQLRAYGADVFLVAAYGKILRPELIAIPRRGVVGVHPSLLPLYRGPAPIQQALLDGIAETGVSLFLVDELVDHGPVIARETFPLVPGTSYLQLEETLARIGGDLAASALTPWSDGTLEPAEQDHDAATFTSKFSTEDAFVAWEELRAALEDEGLAKAIARKVAALNPEPGPWTDRDGVRIKLLSAEIEGGMKITSYQLAGKSAVSGILEIR